MAQMRMQDKEENDENDREYFLGTDKDNDIVLNYHTSLDEVTLYSNGRNGKFSPVGTFTINEVSRCFFEDDEKDLNEVANYFRGSEKQPNTVEDVIDAVLEIDSASVLEELEAEGIPRYDQIRLVSEETGEGSTYRPPSDDKARGGVDTGPREREERFPNYGI